MKTLGPVVAAMLGIALAATGHAATGDAGRGMGPAAGNAPAQVIPAQATPGRWGAVPADRVVRRVQQAGVYCGWVGDGYQADCLADQYAQIARTLPQTAGWDPVRAALAEAERGLADVVTRHRDRATPSTRPEDRGNPSTVRAERALRRVLPSGAGAALRVVSDLETRLLRSVSGSDERAAAFVRVAAAIGSNKQLLRSG